MAIHTGIHIQVIIKVIETIIIYMGVVVFPSTIIAIELVKASTLKSPGDKKLLKNSSYMMSFASSSGSLVRP